MAQVRIYDNTICGDYNRAKIIHSSQTEHLAKHFYIGTGYAVYFYSGNGEYLSSQTGFNDWNEAREYAVKNVNNL